MGNINFELVFGWILVVLGGFAGILYIIELTGRDMSWAFSRRYRYVERMGDKVGSIWYFVRVVVAPLGVGLYLVLS